MDNFYVSATELLHTVFLLMPERAKSLKEGKFSNINTKWQENST